MKNEVKTELKEYTKPEVVVLDVKATAANSGKDVTPAAEGDFFGLFTLGS